MLIGFGQLTRPFFVVAETVEQLMAYGSFEDGGITVQSSEHTDEQLAANLAPVVDDTVVETETPEPVKEAVVETPVKKPRNDPQARIDQAIGKQREAERRAAQAEAELQALRAPKPEAKPVTPPPASTEPTVEQFDTYEKFVDARARWAAKQEWDTRDQERAARESAQQQEGVEREIEEKFGERYGAILADDPEFPTKVDPRLLNTKRLGVLAPEERAHATFGNFLVEQVFQSEHPKELLLHLSDEAIVQRLATLPPIQVIRQLATFEASLGAAPPPGPAPKPNISHAKPPIRPERTSPLAADANEITGEESVDEHIRKMNAADRRRRAS